MDAQNDDYSGQITDLKNNVAKLTHDNGDLKSKIEQLEKDAGEMTKVNKQTQ